MKRVFIAATAAVCVATFVCASTSRAAAPVGDEPYIGPDAGLGFTWDIPDTWIQGGQIPFPLSWDPAIPGSGFEIVEQTPNFYTPSDSQYFSYTFAWWLEGDPNITAADLSTDFAGYYDGLMEGCVYGQYATVQPCDVANYKASFVEIADIGPGPHAVKAFVGEAQLYDFFVTGNLITLHILANTYDCARDGHRAVLYSASPEPFSSPIWKELLARQAAFTCE
jgi:hypothetical protein